MTSAQVKPNVLLTFDFEEWEGQYRIYEADLYTKTKRIVELLIERNIPATFFLDGYTSTRYPDAVTLLADKGFELALHSDYHPGAVRDMNQRKRPMLLDIPDFRQESEKQMARMQNGINMIRQVISDFKPVGFRAPFLLWNKALYQSLGKLNFLYDSSQKKDTFAPYRVDGMMVFPVNSGEYDSACYGLRPQYVLAVWKERFLRARKEAAQENESCFVLLAHPSVSGKTKYIGLVKAILNYMSWCGANYYTCEELLRKLVENSEGM